MNRATAELVTAFGAVTFRSAHGASVVSEGAIDVARAAAEAARFEPFDLAHRGRYAFSDARVPEPVVTELVALGALCTGRRLGLRQHRWVRMVRGDYALEADDAAWVPTVSSDTSPPLDVTLDVSTRETGEAEVVFTRGGAAFFTVAQRPGEVGLVERSPGVARYERYLTHRVGDAQVVRLRLWLAVL